MTSEATDGRPTCTDGWSEHWPTKPGRYWFYGWAYGERTDVSGNPEDPRLESVQALWAGRGAGRHLMVTRSGGFMFKSEGAIGVWHRADVPELPTSLPTEPTP